MIVEYTAAVMHLDHPMVCQFLVSLKVQHRGTVVNVLLHTSMCIAKLFVQTNTVLMVFITLWMYVYIAN